ncbi:MAG: hypothetical protein II067_00375 [Agathobacter sp.]|uniref:hypothetical protein n=1 Tax=Agathobacter sp. TaxID=2021311 RepID=UPI000690E9E0|nr:hypothetical protein [Agathobacter sp.]MBQ1680653.1 hypothetical protein [Agathobacter sp.]
MNKGKFLDKFSGNNVELCHTYNERVGNRTVQLLLDEQIPFTKNCRKIPFFKRDKYNGAEKVWVIETNPHRYGQARRAIDRLDQGTKERLVLSNY